MMKTEQTLHHLIHKENITNKIQPSLFLYKKSPKKQSTKTDAEITHTKKSSLEKTKVAPETTLNVRPSKKRKKNQSEQSKAPKEQPQKKKSKAQPQKKLIRKKLTSFFLPNIDRPEDGTLVFTVRRKCGIKEVLGKFEKYNDLKLEGCDEEKLRSKTEVKVELFDKRLPKGKVTLVANGITWARFGKSFLRSHVDKSIRENIKSTENEYTPNEKQAFIDMRDKLLVWIMGTSKNQQL